MILIKKYSELPICRKEILRYAGCNENDEKISDLIDECLNKLGSKLDFKVCYDEFSVNIDNSICDFGSFAFKSDSLAKNLENCKKVIIFAATIGVEIDRLIIKYSNIAPSKALIFQAIGTERIETLCDRFCDDIKSKTNLNLRPRFSPGYGDLPLEVQKNIFSVLDCTKKIGIFLNQNLLMLPTKSVTAIVGLTEKQQVENKSKCSTCNKKDCEFKREIL